MTAPSHHPSDALLVAYAAGSLGEPLALVVATHLALCPECRARDATLDAIGGGLLDDLPPTAIAGDALDRVLARLDEAAPEPRHPAPQGPWPEPLGSYLAAGGPVAWRWLGPGLRRHAIGGARGATAHLLKAVPGAAVPPHGHGGLELTLVLRGSYRDGAEIFATGDLQEVDDDAMHRPRALPGEDCICLVANERPLRPTRRIDRLIRSILRV